MWLPRMVLFLSAAACLALWTCYLARPEAFVALTMWPAWFWGVPGLAVTVLTLRVGGRRAGALVLGLWLVFLGTCAEEPKALLTLFRRWPTPEWKRAHAEGRAIRVACLNCAGGSEQAAAEVVPYRPDIVLLQELPGQSELERLLHRLFGDDGGVVSSWDTAVLCRGKAKETRVPRDVRVYTVSARVMLRDGIEVRAISTHLYPPVVRLDLWNPECWRSARQNHSTRTRQAQALAHHLKGIPEHIPIVLAGDFNAPAGDRIFRLFAPRLHDAFAESGVGWGNTVTNETPVSRFDQVWVSPHFRVAGAISKKTRYSDHRMVICDLVLSR